MGSVAGAAALERERGEPAVPTTRNAGFNDMVSLTGLTAMGERSDLREQSERRIILASAAMPRLAICSSS